MLFNSSVFILVFLPITLLVFWLLIKLKLIPAILGWLLITSVFFYSYWNIFSPAEQGQTPQYIVLIILSIIFNHQMGAAIAAAKPASKQANLLLIVGMVLNLSLIAYYKYANFLLSSINQIFWSNLTIGHVLLPLGISFYTFTQIGYLVDAYRGEMKNEKYDLPTYSLFVLFFPHLIAGPIVRHDELIPQLRSLRTFIFSPKNLALGLTMFSLGLSKKILIADTISGWIAPVFDNSNSIIFLEAWVGALGYTLQLYFDFSGYSDMAIGLGWMFNIALPINFDSPYKAQSIDIIRIKPKTIFLGSSRAKQGLNPNHPALSNAQPVYNLAIDGVNPYEILRYLEHTIKNQPELKQVILGIDFFMFNEFLHNQQGFSEDRLEKNYITLPDIMNSLFSLDTLEVSRESIIASLNAPNDDYSYGENGFRPHRYFKDGKTKTRFEYSINDYFHFHHQYNFSDKYFSDFVKIVKLAQEKGIKLIIFISPSHVTERETIRVTKQWESWENWKRKMVQITPVWDFSGYNSVTTEPIKAVMENYADNSHYTPKVGNLILDRIFSYQENQVPSDFGVLMTPENIEAHLEKIRQDRATWSQKRKNKVKLLKKLERNFVQQQKSTSQ